MFLAYWVLEKVLVQSEKQLEKLERLLKHCSGVWVNIARREIGWHKKIRDKIIVQKGPIYMNRTGSDWGLACNAIHFLDLLSWWSEETIEEVDTSNLSCTWYPAKREGFYEVNGVLTALFSRGSKARMECLNGNGQPVINVSNSAGEWRIDETIGVAVKPNGELLEGQMERTSDMTGRVIGSILNSGTCNLPTLSESSSLHRPMIQALLDHFRYVFWPRPTLYPMQQQYSLTFAN